MGSLEFARKRRPEPVVAAASTPLTELAKKYGVHAGQISTWKRTALDNMSAAFERRGGSPDTPSSADIDKLHSKIGQLVVDRDFLADASVQLLGTRGKNGEQGS